ncbi:MAG: Multiple antibiotic resistance protein MarR [Candidatus Celerinatantimonas neptuna]|nr:MAG: Multiple antibiotic resistance protein MarR [Candidatus Celerinatantimonas neptuna]
MTYFKLTSLTDGSLMTIGHLIHLLNQLKDKVLSDHLTPLDITAQQFKVLLLLNRDDEFNTCKKLSQRLCIDAGAITRMVDRLEKKGLIKRTRDKTDRRCVSLELTDNGQNLCEQFPPLIVDALNELTQGLSNDEIQQLEMLITKVLATNGVTNGVFS